MPDFTMKQSFPMASVIEAAQRKAALEQQAQEQGNKSLIEGLQSIGQVGQSLVDKRMKVAQALALGKQFDIPEDQARLMSPEQVAQVGNIKKSNVDMRSLLLSMHPELGNNPTFMASFGSNATTGQGAMPASQAPAPQPANGAVLASNVTTTPIPTGQSLTPSATEQTPVPIQAPPAMPKTVNKATADMVMKAYLANKQEPVVTRSQAEAQGGVSHGTHILPDANNLPDKKEQDTYWRDAVRGLQSIRGDTALKDIETQRNAATQAYNRLKDIELTGKAPNPIDYVDILGQVYKARTGTAPTQEVLKEAKQVTGQAQFGKYWTYFSGQQMPGTSKDIASSLKDMVSHMGLQADELHDGYMQVHGSQVFNPNMSEENVKKLSKLSRGKSFADSTGIKAEDFDPHVQAVKWAQANPNDPRSAAILKKAQDEIMSKSGGSIGL